MIDCDEKHPQNSKRNVNDVQNLKKEVKANDEKQQNHQNSEDVGSQENLEVMVSGDYY